MTSRRGSSTSRIGTFGLVPHRVGEGGLGKFAGNAMDRLAQSPEALRIPCVVAPGRRPRTFSSSAMSLSGRPATAPLNSQSPLRIASSFFKHHQGFVGSGMRCSRPAFMRSGGMMCVLAQPVSTSPFERAEDLADAAVRIT